jgi:hypothetical protein
MIDFMSGFADVTHKVMETELLQKADRANWTRELRQLERRDRQRAAKGGGRTVIVSQPEHLRGMHKVWF